MDTKVLVSAALSLLTGFGGSVAYVYSEFTPQREFDYHVAQDRTRTVLDLIEVLSRTSEGDVTRGTLCNALQAEIALICSEAGSHPFCVDRQSLVAKAGCG